MYKILVVRDIEIFLDRLLDLPSDSEIEFNIEVIYGTTPVSIASYRMDPVELKELKMQLEELLDRSFIKLISLL